MGTNIIPIKNYRTYFSSFKFDCTLSRAKPKISGQRCTKINVLSREYEPTDRGDGEREREKREKERERKIKKSITVAAKVPSMKLKFQHFITATWAIWMIKMRKHDWLT